MKTAQAMNTITMKYRKTAQPDRRSLWVYRIHHIVVRLLPDTRRCAFSLTDGYGIGGDQGGLINKMPDTTIPDLRHTFIPK